MQIGGVGSNSANFQQQVDHHKSENHSIEKQIKELQEEKSTLTQKLDDARNLFALSQSDEYQQLKKQLEQVEEQLVEIQAKQHTAEAQKVKEASQITDAEQSSLTQIDHARRFDSYSHVEKESAGIYQTAEENGKLVILMDGIQKNQQDDDKQREE